ncbi:proto-oncogene Mas [Pipistrellus kuhlii]|uniref:MAS1 proto-oncogene, G protein-coupled receptor n=1 Tax=Pipistrellus kuhlii TaxID=59472 RepID=A0A7J7YNZ0_PIPKU|nr:proto-oncogene Mas [Pipistrellus kuhlii]KAF6363220.1 MAS1 proto-oncogene, G protein-coupled receptor [Pipistrellus kuhlii]
MSESNVTALAAEGPANASAGRNASARGAPEVPAVLWAILGLSPLGLVGNAVLLWFLCFRVRRSPFTVYITHLSAADVCLLLCVSLLTVHYALGFQLSAGLSYTIVTLSATFLFGYNTGLYLLTAISVERCLSVLFPIWYRCHRPRHQSALVCALLWALSCLVTATEYALCIDSERPGYAGSRCRPVIILIAVLSFLVFTPLMVASSAVLLVRVRRSARASPSARLYAVIAAAVAVFLAFAMPMRVLYLLYYEYWSTFGDLHDVSVLFSAVNSSANPFIYFFVGSSRGRRFQEPLRVVLTRAFKDDTQARRPGDSGPSAESAV